MTGYSKKSVDKYIRRRIMYWIYDLGRNAHLYLKDELGLSTNDKDALTDNDKGLIKSFQEAVRDSVIVTGGAFTSMLLGEEPNDLDIYFATNTTATLVTNFFLNKMKDKGNIEITSHVHQIYVKTRPDNEGLHIMLRSVGVAGEDIDQKKYKYFEAYPEASADEFFATYKKNFGKNIPEKGRSYDVTFMTSNAITLNNGLQFIIRFTGDPETIHSNFDFIHATNYWTWEEGVVYNVEALRATHEKRLYYFGSKFPVASIFRLKKFIERGWRISAGEMVKIMFDISKLDLTDISVLREQSIGMDSAYFNEAISILVNRDESDGDLDRTYLFKVLDQVFQTSDKHDDFLETKDAEEDVSTTENFTLPIE